MFVVQRSRMFFSLKNTPLMLIQKNSILQSHGNLNTTKLLPVTSATQLLDPKSIHLTSEHYTSVTENVQPRIGLLEKMIRKSGLVDLDKYRRMVLGYLVYEHVMNQLDYPFFFRYFNMADTFFSWFLVTELHVWMIMVRYMAEGKNGQLIRNNAVSAMWEDTNARINKLGLISNKVKNKQVMELSHQFNAAIIGYDEGIQSDDKILAGALWRRFFQHEGNNPEHLEILIIYVRKQICLLDNIPSSEILKRPTFQLIDIQILCKHQ